MRFKITQGVQNPDRGCICTPFSFSQSLVPVPLHETYSLNDRQGANIFKKDENDVRRAVNEAKEKFGRIDVMVNNA